MNDNAPALTPPEKQKQPATKPSGDRTPIPIERLLFSVANVHGIKMPSGQDGRGEIIKPTLNAGMEGDVRTEIEHRPWMRVFRVTRSKRITRSGLGVNAKEVVTWEAMGKPFHIPDAWAVSVPVED